MSYPKNAFFFSILMIEIRMRDLREISSFFFLKVFESSFVHNSSTARKLFLSIMLSYTKHSRNFYFIICTFLPTSFLQKEILLLPSFLHKMMIFIISTCFLEKLLRVPFNPNLIFQTFLCEQVLSHAQFKILTK